MLGSFGKGRQIIRTAVRYSHRTDPESRRTAFDAGTSPDYQSLNVTVEE
jgi:hypothetical protein